MGQAYKIDRVNLITYNGQKRKILRSMRCRYLAKSQVIRCNGQSQIYEFINFRGSHFKKVNFTDAVFYGCDFWGTSFNDCNFGHQPAAAGISEMLISMYSAILRNSSANLNFTLILPFS